MKGWNASSFSNTFSSQLSPIFRLLSQVGFRVLQVSKASVIAAFTAQYQANKMTNESTHQVFDKITTTDNDQAQELKKFDHTRAGVAELVVAGVTKIPRIFINPPDDAVPVIDLDGIDMVNDDTGRKEMIKQVQNAAENWGFFQVVNHGVPAEMMDEMLERIRQFNEQPKEEKSKFYTRDGMKKVVYNSFYDEYRKAIYWRDSITFMASPKFPDPTEMPIQFRDILLDYSKHVTNLGKALLELLSEILGLEKEHLMNGMGCLEVLYISCHYYPRCPQPELTIGTPKHSDRDCLTILQQDQVGGLQILHQGRWVDVPPIEGALVINIGDYLQFISNNRFISAEHRALASRVGPRISVGSFFTKSTDIHKKI